MIPSTNARRILVVLKAGSAVPSAIVRGLIYRDLFVAHGFEVTYFKLDSEKITRLLDRAGSRQVPLLQQTLIWMNRIFRGINMQRLIRIAPRFDVIYLLKCGSIELYSLLRRSTSQARIVFDLNDSQWLASRAKRAKTIGLDALLRSVDCVTCDNEYTAVFARHYNDKVYLVPDPSQVELFDQFRSHVQKPQDEVILGWIGSPETARNLYLIWEVLEELFKRHAHIHLRLVGVGHDRRLWPPFENVRYSTMPVYSTNDMIREVLRMHVGLFPLYNVEDSLVRGVLKATIYMSGEAAVVCSRVGQCQDLISDGENGMLASTSEEWLQKIDTLIANPAQRSAIARRGVETVRQRYLLDATFRALSTALTGADF